MEIIAYIWGFAVRAIFWLLGEKKEKEKDSRDRRVHNEKMLSPYIEVYHQEYIRSREALGGLDSRLFDILQALVRLIDQMTIEQPECQDGNNYPSDIYTGIIKDISTIIREESMPLLKELSKKRQEYKVGEWMNIWIGELDSNREEKNPSIDRLSCFFEKIDYIKKNTRINENITSIFISAIEKEMIEIEKMMIKAKDSVKILKNKIMQNEIEYFNIQEEKIFYEKYHRLIFALSLFQTLSIKRTFISHNFFITTQIIETGIKIFILKCEIGEVLYPETPLFFPLDYNFFISENESLVNHNK